MSELMPDLKPHVPPAPPGSEACGCCDGVQAETPQGLFNRPGLPTIGYRIGDWARFRASLHAALSSSRFRALDKLRTRDEDDFSIGLIDAFACAADVLGFYQERIANESFLRTATERVSLQELGKLVGYRLRPGVAAETWLAFALDTPPVPPAALAPEPGNFVTGVPAQLALPAGLQVQSVPGPGERPQTFETVEVLPEARPEWNAMRPWLSETRQPGRGDTVSFVAGVRNNLKAGDALLILGDEFRTNPDSNQWDFRILDSVELQAEEDRTLLRWKRGLGSIAPFMNPAAQAPQLFVLRGRAAPFGHNAPMWGSMSAAFRRGYPGGPNSPDEWPNFVLAPAQAAGQAQVDLDALRTEVQNGGWVVLAKGGFNYPAEPAPAGTYVELYRVSNVAEVSRAEFALSAKLTRLKLRGANFEDQFRKRLRETAVFLQSEALALAPYPVQSPVAGDRIPVAVGAQGLEPGRRLLVRGNRAGDGAAVTVQATLVAVQVLDAGRCVLEIAPPLPAALVRASVVVHANVALASHGESVSQILGSGDASQPFQRFELRQLPLTWRAAANERGAAAELTVRVGDIAWTRRDTLFGTGPGERCYTLATDAEGRDFAQFGDGLRGARLPSRANNVRAAYRKGLGAEGNVPADRLTQLMSRPLGLKSVANPIAASGGTDPEPAEAARQSIPLGTRTLGRAVSVLDYEDFARAFSGIAKAQAQVLQLPAGPTVTITVAGAAGAPLTPADPVWVHLLGALQASGDPHVPVRLLGFQAAFFRLGIRVRRDPDWPIEVVLAAVEATLRARFGFDARSLGQTVQQSEVIAAAQAVPGVVAVDLTRFHGGTQPVAQTLPSVQVRLLAARMRVANGVALPAQVLTLASGPLDLLEEMP